MPWERATPEAATGVWKVDPHRSAGIGRPLMREAEERAHDAGCYKLQLLSYELREDAHRFYESLGYRASARGYRKYL